MIMRSRLAADLTRLGLSSGDAIMVHASLRSLGPILGGPDVLILALLDVIGPGGTIMAYADWEHSPNLWVDEGDAPPDLHEFDELPPFDPQTSRARRAYGALPELLRTWPNAVRSANPGASVCAIGARAGWLCADHPLQYGYGDGSPLAKLADVPGKRIVAHYEPILVDGQRQWVRIEEYDTGFPALPGAPENCFEQIVQAFLAEGRGESGRIGHAASHALDAASLHAYAVRWMEAHYGGDITLRRSP